MVIKDSFVKDYYYVTEHVMFGVGQLKSGHSVEQQTQSSEVLIEEDAAVIRGGGEGWQSAWPSTGVIEDKTGGEGDELSRLDSLTGDAGD